MQTIFFVSIYIHILVSVNLFQEGYWSILYKPFINGRYHLKWYLIISKSVAKDIHEKCSNFKKKIRLYSV